MTFAGPVSHNDHFLYSTKKLETVQTVKMGIVKLYFFFFLEPTSFTLMATDPLTRNGTLAHSGTVLFGIN